MTSDDSITQNYLKKILSYNPNTGIFTRKIKTSNSVHVGDIAGWIKTTCGKKYRQISIKNNKYLAHRIAWLYMTGSFPPNEIDHADGNGLNNKFVNLSAVTRSENRKNIRRQSNNTSGICGVSWNEPRNKWETYIKINSKIIHLGRFTTLFAAAYARHAAEIKYGFHKNHGTDRPL